MHKLVILEYDHNQKIWYQNLAKKAFLVLQTLSFLWLLSYPIMCACIMKTTTEVNNNDTTLH